MLFVMISLFFLTLLPQAPRRAARTDGRATQQIHQHPIQVRPGRTAHIRRAVDGRRGGTLVIPLVAIIVFL